MKNNLYSVDIQDWRLPTTTSNDVLVDITYALENGNLVFFPKLAFTLDADERSLLSPSYSDGKAKNISFNLHTGELQGAACQLNVKHKLQTFLQRYAEQSVHFIKTLLPQYADQLQVGRTSLRPVEISGRKNPSIKKDDTRLHVDAFPATPNQGRRILRLFTNVNLKNKPRIWHVGEPFSQVAKTFLPLVPRQTLGSGQFMKLLKITKGLRTEYDHIMLHIHDRMKMDQAYQDKISFTEIAFPAHSSWLVFTDQVSHAALAGQQVFEQTFYLPVAAMRDPDKSPLRVLEKLMGRQLI